MSDHPEPGTPRFLPDFLKHGDAATGFPHPTPLARMRAVMGMPAALDGLPPLATTHGQDARGQEDEAAGEWLRHVLAGRLG